MRLISSTRNKVVLQLGKAEKHLLFDLLKLYPRIPPAHYRLTRSGGLPDQEGSEKLLDDALAEQRAENKRQLLELIADPARVDESPAGCRLSLSRGDVEWLLQVLNDIRVGSWVRLGAPEPKLDLKKLDEKTAPDFLTMELAGEFQMELLGLLRQK